MCDQSLPKVGNDVAEPKAGAGAIDGAEAAGTAAVDNGAAGEPNPNEVVTVGAKQTKNNSSETRQIDFCSNFHQNSKKHTSASSWGSQCWCSSKCKSRCKTTTALWIHI